MMVHENTKYLKLPFQFSEAQLVRDLASILDSNWKPHFNKADYHGDWKVIALYAVNGEASNIFAYPTPESVISETPILEACPYFKEVINTFKCRILTARILRLGAGAQIKPHRDHELGYEYGNFRMHIPITTNPGVQFVLDGNELQMIPGECWYTNVSYVHSVNNTGNSDRVHLVIDGERNEWSDELFFGLAPKSSFHKASSNNYTPETLKRIIEELSQRNEPAVKPLIEELSRELSALNETHG